MDASTPASDGAGASAGASGTMRRMVSVVEGIRIQVPTTRDTEEEHSVCQIERKKEIEEIKSNRSQEESR
jgi:hypothetical protein